MTDTQECDKRLKTCNGRFNNELGKIVIADNVHGLLQAVNNYSIK